MKNVLLADKAVRLSEKLDLKINDWVVYHLTSYEQQKQRATVEEVNLIKYTLAWSPPVRVVRVLDNAVEVAIGEGGATRTVPARYVRRLCSDIPQSLQALNLNVVEREAARYRTKPEWSSSPGPRKRVRQEA